MDNYKTQIEWYPDGFTMDEQKELITQAKQSKIPMKVSEKFKAEAADKLISDLRVKLAAAEEYIQELEEGRVQNEYEQKYSELLNEFKKVSESRNALKQNCERYRTLIKDIKTRTFNTDPIIKEYEERIKNLKEQNSTLKKQVDSIREIRDKLLTKNLQYEKLLESSKS